MFIAVEQLQDRRVSFDGSFPPGHIDYLSEGIEQVAPLMVRGAANLLGGEIEIRGRLSTTMEMSCARCLDPVRHPVDKDFDLVYRSIRAMTRGDEFEVPRGEEELGFYRGDGLLLEDVAKEQVLLSLPMKIVCRSDCSGLCPQCGCNLNREACGCASRRMDSRWEGLLRQ